VKLKDKRVWITGASGTIGGAIVEKFEKEGAEVLTRRIDITDKYDVKMVVDNWSPDILVNCAGMFGPTVPLNFGSFYDWEKTIDVNFISAAYLTRCVLSPMLKRKEGKIIHFSGGGSAYGLANLSAYASSKAALVRFVECISLELEDTGIDINIIAPGSIKSKMNPTGTGTPDRAVALALFLASEESNGISGRLISAVYDNWSNIDLDMLPSDAGTLRRVPLNKVAS
jgi:NAD(P)-dependent dehydrogenase (short-subunit alcohol dehydrogenase family)